MAKRDEQELFFFTEKDVFNDVKESNDVKEINDDVINVPEFMRMVENYGEWREFNRLFKGQKFKSAPCKKVY